MDEMTVKVLYRKDKFTGEIIAFLPEVKSRFGSIEVYMHDGQHSGASLDYYHGDTIPAKESEYKELHDELNKIYDNELTIRKRMNYKDFDWV